MSVPFGSGVDGDLNITGSGTTFNLNTDTSASRSYADGIAYKVQTDPITVDISIGVTPNGLTGGDYILLINFQGTASDYADVGNYELLQIDTIGTDYVTVFQAPTESYGGSTFSNQKVAIQRVPQYDNVTISGGGSLTASAYDRLATAPAGAAGYYTGIVAVMVDGVLTIDSLSDNITVAGKGYKGGPEAPSAGDYGWGYAGERTRGYSSSRETSAAYKPDGGGGAAKGSASSGGGGGYGTAGSNGIAGIGIYGIGAASFGDSTLSSINFGGGGGSAGSHSSGRIGAPGGVGGGMVYLHARNLVNRGYIDANGGAGVDGTNNGDFSGGGGGGGAGGGVYLKVIDFSSLADSVTSLRGDGGSGVGTHGKDGGNGGYGRIRIDYSIVNGTNYPDDAATDSIANPNPYTIRLPEGWYYFSGYTKMTYVPVSRKIYCYRRDNGKYMGYTTSSGDGSFSVITTYTGTHFLVALDNDGEASYNDLVIGNVVPYYYNP